MANLQKLKIELAEGHPVTGPYSLNAQTAADQINTLNIAIIRAIRSTELLAWSGQASIGDRPRIIKIEEGKANPDEQCVALCITAEEMIKRDNTELDLNIPDRVAMLNALVQYDVLSQADKQSLEAIAQEYISRAVQLEIGIVRAGTIEQARNL
tara:strand:+ start:404 stop:865 length:462 start_codon:yes stop_codon:yes gene_type:complete